ncbi:hypothetical protein RF11_02946 [Thelohanellus kitauei]|uniref:Uncharacterized protein n=1 Tax=Thelohanellus kitauei TaxID=669202 RepID=A0A0C2N517_THEKT|nr:hypothetical protein RF11_02946 [Thelohanellus kitauei]
MSRGFESNWTHLLRYKYLVSKNLATSFYLFEALTEAQIPLKTFELDTKCSLRLRVWILIDFIKSIFPTSKPLRGYSQLGEMERRGLFNTRDPIAVLFTEVEITTIIFST